MTLLELYQQMIHAYPSFENTLLLSDNKELPYIIAEEYVDCVMNASNQSNFISFLEKLVTHPDEKVSEWGVIGFLEGIQFKLIHPEENKRFSDMLLPHSKEYWDSLNKFWERL